MRTDEQVRHHSEPRGSSLAAELTPELSGLRGGVIENRLKADAEEFHCFGKPGLGLEMRANFSPDDLAGDQGSGIIGIAKGFARSLAMNGVSAQNIEKDG